MERTHTSPSASVIEYAEKASTLPKVLRLAWEGNLGKHATGALFMSCGAVLGVQPGVEFKVAAAAAEEVGAR